MRHAALIWAGACAAFLPFAAAAQDDAAVEPAPAAEAPAPAPRASPTPRYNWAQIDFVSSYTNFADPDFTGDDRFASEAGYRISGSYLIEKPFYLTASYGNDAYSFRLGGEKIELDDTAWSAGVGAFFPLAPRTHITAGATYEGGTLSSGDGDIDAAGFGIQLGLRFQATPSVETALTYKYKDQTLETPEGDEFDSIANIFGATLVGNLSRNVALVLRLERSVFTDEGFGLEFDGKTESYSIGLRFRL